MKIKIATQADILNAYRKAMREAEIEMFGHPLPVTKYHRNKTTYTRKVKHKSNYE